MTSPKFKLTYNIKTNQLYLNISMTLPQLLHVKAKSLMWPILLNRITGSFGMTLQYFRRSFSTSDQDQNHLEMCPKKERFPPNRLFFIFTKQFLTQDRFDQLRWNFA